jgi:hypothetical protein
MVKVAVNGRTYTNEQVLKLIYKLIKKIRILGTKIRIARKVYPHFEEDINNYIP